MTAATAPPPKPEAGRRSAGRRMGTPAHWQEWSFAWQANDVGRHTLRAQATDGAGNVQPKVPPWNRLAYGNNALDVIYVDVR